MPTCKSTWKPAFNNLHNKRLVRLLCPFLLDWLTPGPGMLVCDWTHLLSVIFIGTGIGSGKILEAARREHWQEKIQYLTQARHPYAKPRPCISNDPLVLSPWRPRASAVREVENAPFSRNSLWSPPFNNLQQPEQTRAFASFCGFSLWYYYVECISSLITPVPDGSRVQLQSKAESNLNIVFHLPFPHVMM